MYPLLSTFNVNICYFFMGTVTKKAKERVSEADSVKNDDTEVDMSYAGQRGVENHAWRRRRGYGLVVR